MERTESILNSLDFLIKAAMIAAVTEVSLVHSP